MSGYSCGDIEIKEYRVYKSSSNEYINQAGTSNHTTIYIHKSFDMGVLLIHHILAGVLVIPECTSTIPIVAQVFNKPSLRSVRSQHTHGMSVPTHEALVGQNIQK